MVVAILVWLMRDSLLSEMKEVYGITPTEEHYTCAIDALARGGRLQEAEQMLNGLQSPKPTYLMWKTMLAACRHQSTSDMAERYASKALALVPPNEAASIHLLRASVFAAEGQWAEHDSVRHQTNK